MRLCECVPSGVQKGVDSPRSPSPAYFRNTLFSVEGGMRSSCTPLPPILYVSLKTQGGCVHLIHAGYLCGSGATSSTETVCGGDGDMFCPKGSSAASKVGGGQGRDKRFAVGVNAGNRHSSLTMKPLVWRRTTSGWRSPRFGRRRWWRVKACATIIAAT